VIYTIFTPWNEAAEGAMERGLILKWRKENDVDQIGLARMTGITQGHMSDFLAGKKGLSWNNIVSIAKETHIDLNALAGLKRQNMAELKLAPEGIQLDTPGTRVLTFGKIKIKISGVIDAEIVNSD